MKKLAILFALTPELLIQGIADLTGWDLTLGLPAISGQAGLGLSWPIDQPYQWAGAGSDEKNH